MRVDFDDKIEKNFLNDEIETRKINESIFENCIFFSDNTEKKIFNELKDKYDKYKVNYSEENLKHKIKNQINKAYNFSSIIFLLLIILFAINFSNMTNGDIILSYISVSLYIGYKSLINNYKHLFQKFLRLILFVAMVSSFFNKNKINKEELIINNNYIYENTIIQSSNNKDLLINIVTNEVYDIKNINNQLNKVDIKDINKNCVILTVNYLYKNKKDYLQDKTKFDKDNNYINNQLDLITDTEKSIDFYCSKTKN